jgi:hypothetical protein
MNCFGSIFKVIAIKNNELTAEEERAVMDDIIVDASLQSEDSSCESKTLNIEYEYFRW